MQGCHSGTCGCKACRDKRRHAALAAAKKQANRPPDAAACSASSEYRRGYSSGYQAGWKRGRHELAMSLQPETKESPDVGDGYTCAACKIQRPRDWYIYEIDRDGVTLSPCCALCAREEKSRGPFPSQNVQGQPTAGEQQTNTTNE